MKTDAEPYDYVNLSSFDLTKRFFTPKRGYTLIVIQCRVTNGQNSTQRLWTAISDNKVHTALIGLEGGEQPPIGYDFEGGPIQSKPLAPQAILNFTVVFSVPQGAKLKDMLFTLRNNSSFEKGKDVRVLLSSDQKSNTGATKPADSDLDQEAKDVVSALANVGARAGAEGPARAAKEAARDVALNLRAHLRLSN